MFPKKNKNKHKLECLKCQYQTLLKKGKVIFDNWDKVSKPPKELMTIQKELIKLKKIITKNKSEAAIRFCSEHPGIFEFAPIEWA